MSQLMEIQAAQKTMEDCFLKRMGELEAQIQSSGPAKDTVAKVAEEFRAFRELIFNMLGILRKQIAECAKSCDAMETRFRRKSLIFSGIVETEKEDCTAVVVKALSSKLAVTDISVASVQTCHRLGNSSNRQPRPILVRFHNVETKNRVWKAKTGFKGTPISVKEFLTKPRQAVFGRARMHFGLRACWTQDGAIIIKTPDGTRSKISTMDELNPLLVRFPKGVEDTSLRGAGSSGSTNAGTRNGPRKA